MADKKDALQQYNALRDLTMEALRKLADLADARKATVTVDGVETQRGELLREDASALENDRFTLAVVGEFSRGKSTLINALLECEELLPTAIEPATAAITVVVYGEETSVSIHYEDGGVARDIALEQLPDYILGKDLDGKNSQAELTASAGDLIRKRGINELSVDDFFGADEEQEAPAAPTVRPISRVEITYPSEFLGNNIRLADTPGIGSIDPQHGEATRKFIRKADAILFLINTDPVISASECNFLTFLQDYVDHFLFAVTKIDQFTDDERERSLAFTRDAIQEFAGLDDPSLYPVSAKLAMEGMTEDDPNKIAQSGFPEFLRALDEFLIAGRGQRVMRKYVALARAHFRELRQGVQLDQQGLDLDMEEIGKRVEKSRPELQKAREAEARIVRLLDEELANAADLVSGATGMDWIRLSTAIHEEVLAQIDDCDWQQLQQATEIIPIFVREIVTEELRPKIDEIAGHLAALRAQVLEESQQAIQDLNDNIAFEFGDLGEVDEEEFAFRVDADLVSANLRQISTITIGSTIALALATGFLFGGIGVIVTLGGGLLAGTQLTSVFRRRARERIKREIDEPLAELVDTILENLEKEVVENLAAFRQSVARGLERAISGVEQSIDRLKDEMRSAELDSPERKQALESQQQAVADIESLLQQAQFLSL